MDRRKFIRGLPRSLVDDNLGFQGTVFLSSDHDEETFHEYLEGLGGVFENFVFDNDCTIETFCYFSGNSRVVLENYSFDEESWYREIGKEGVVKRFGVELEGNGLLVSVSKTEEDFFCSPGGIFRPIVAGGFRAFGIDGYVLNSEERKVYRINKKF